MRPLLLEACASPPGWGVPVVVLGTGRTGALLVQILREQPPFGLRPLVLVDDDLSKQEQTIEAVPVVRPLSVASTPAAKGLRFGLLTMPGIEHADLVERLERRWTGFTHLILMPNLFRMANLWLLPRNFGGLLALEVKHRLLVRGSCLARRTLDRTAVPGGAVVV